MAIKEQAVLLHVQSSPFFEVRNGDMGGHAFVKCKCTQAACCFTVLVEDRVT